ncbi:MAG TPA: NADP-dependent oxidoreductase [Ktedonobacteraceae bacterium]|nr:NADP-dependent oxidoreductase [Ktedonobacteraceae bacterium]
MVTTNTPSMKAICFHEYGGPEVLKYENVPRPEPQHGQVLIQVRAAAVNPVDWKIREGWLASMIPLQFPTIAGTDVAGVVMATGQGVTDFRVGQDVYGFVGIGSGAYAEYTTATIETIALQPRTLDYVQAASVPLVATTAWQALFEAGGLKEGQTVLVHGGAGGVGTFAVQLAKMKGAYVLATASSQNVEFVKGLGADEVIDYTTTPFETVAHHVDVVLDVIGGETEQRSWGVLKPGGILVSTLGPPSQEDAAKHRVRAAFVQAQPTAGLLKEIARLLDSGQIKPNVGKMFPMEQARQAQELKQHGHTRGKIVLEIAR